MNLAHVHLILNHAPVVAFPLLIFILAYGFYRREQSVQCISLFCICLASLVLIPIYFTGDPAEHVLKKVMTVSEEFIEPHEDAALVSLVLGLATGVAAALSIYVKDKAGHFRKLNIVTLSLGFFTIIALTYTAYRGGLIRHTELRDPPETSAARNDVNNGLKRIATVSKK